MSTWRILRIGAFTAPSYQPRNERGIRVKLKVRARAANQGRP